MEKDQIDKQINRRTFISFTVFSIIGTSFIAGWKWLYNSPKEIPGITAGAREPLRRALNANEILMKNLFDPKQLVETYPVSMAAKKVRQNGNVGLKGPIIAEDWKLGLFQERDKILEISLSDIKKLPKTEIVFDFKCVEGWDQISHWGGVKFQDLIDHYKLDHLSGLKYVGMATPDNKYYIGLDMPSAIHPQTLLCYEMNGKDLPISHGYPLRLIVPVKYGIKSLKRISSITFSDSRPRDYWAERGYDYYSGL